MKLFIIVSNTDIKKIILSCILGILYILNGCYSSERFNRQTQVFQLYFRFLGRTIQFICLYDAVLAQVSFEIPKQHSVLALTTTVVFFTAFFSINGLAVKNMVS